MERLIIYEQGICKLDLKADYKELKLGTYDRPPPDHFVLNNNTTMSVLKQIKTTDNYEHLWTLSMLLDKKINGKLTAEISDINTWCSKCRSEIRSYKFDKNHKIYKAVNTGVSYRCINCTDEKIKFYNHPKFVKSYTFTKCGDNYVHKEDYKGEITYTILTDDQYTMFKFFTYNIKYHPKITHTPEEKNTGINCTVCGTYTADYWKHNESCIKNINKFAIQIYSPINWLIRNLDNIPTDVKNLISNNLVAISTY